ncbi:MULTISPECIES: phosphatase PAP2 family protein [Streptomyces]|uniref:Phosphatase PAP2 family protein n=1 Tax=Streptomyces violaceoruber TaxID=1935 RepID=A0A1V0U526_STRVN|nr:MULTISPECIES: phosphatase PAP2 family protein [Streptomyces]ARF60303.1 phosphatase PAP2 family protein [Streptomyces violaceoruber]KOG80706.1 membrane protein [Streptomyces griseus subsp. rhodochrous]MBD3555095.1 phosphatase PAP2 family protein [Streptomyces sp. SP18CM02]MCC0576360.1 phosphatase PAP2 family protein [Streptomyces californicus]
MPSPHSPAPALVSRPAAAPRIAAVAGAASLILLALVAARWSPLMSLDRAVADALHRHAVAEPGAVAVSRVLTDWVWDPWTMRALIAVTVVALWWRNARLLALWVAATSLLASLLQQGLKAAVGRERPEWPDPVDSAQYAAYPSGHAMTAVVSCGLLVWLLGLHGGGPGLRWAALAVALVSAVGVAATRVYLGVHWLTDVVGGTLLGVAVVACCATGYARYAAPSQRSTSW